LRNPEIFGGRRGRGGSDYEEQWVSMG